MVLICAVDKLIFLQLTNIIWGEAGENDDHIVPFQEGNENYRSKKEWSQEGSSIKPTERKTQGVKIDYNDKKLENISNTNSNERTSVSGFSLDSWPDLSLSNDAKADKDTSGTDATENVADITKFDLTSNGKMIAYGIEIFKVMVVPFFIIFFLKKKKIPTAEKAELAKDPELFQNPNGGKDQGDFVDYSWDNIGSFDDLDRIFR